MQYLSGGKTDSTGLLARYLPPVPEGLGRAFLAGFPAPNPWVLDPFGASPGFAVELARAGARVLVTAGNPVARFLLDLAAHPPALADLQAALSDLASARKDQERLETHLQSIYLTRCSRCGRELPAEAFLWDHRTGALTGRIYNCACGSGGEQPAAPEDLERAASWSRTDGLHRSRALGRLVPVDDPDRPSAEEALEIYLPRAVYALGTLVNRLDAIVTTDERRRCLLALLLWAFDSANALWPPLAAERPRPRQLTFPTLFRENNVWMALEAGVKSLGSAESSRGQIPHSLWPEEPPESGGLCIFEGPLRDLAPELSEIPLKAIAGVVPRPNQAFWTLSALWSGWLWGREAVGPFKSVLRRRRYDWNWQTEALKALFTSLAENTSAEIPFFGILAEPEPAFLSAAFLAARLAGFRLDDFAVRAEQEPAQVRWKKAPRLPPARLPLAENFARKALREILEQHGQPLPYLSLHAAALAAFISRGMLPGAGEGVAAFEMVIQAALGSPDFIDLEGRAAPERGLWALTRWGRQEQFPETRPGGA